MLHRNIFHRADGNAHAEPAGLVVLDRGKVVTPNVSINTQLEPQLVDIDLHSLPYKKDRLFAMLCAEVCDTAKKEIASPASVATCHYNSYCIEVLSSLADGIAN